MHLIHIIACPQGEKRLLLALIFPLALDGRKTLFQTLVTHEMLFSFADYGFQWFPDEFFFQQEPG